MRWARVPLKDTGGQAFWPDLTKYMKEVLILVGYQALHMRTIGWGFATRKV